ncbi:MAG: hypothetical protein B6I30_10190 [Desulfobacteraceae bacterium 4572_187]|nr:MAG: hypothetical protein B6I30_10190 [Desulfobacteraceae bacterium 4572_187]
MNNRKIIENLIAGICERKNINFTTYNLNLAITDVMTTIETIAAGIDQNKYDCFYIHENSKADSDDKKED